MTCLENKTKKTLKYIRGQKKKKTGQNRNIVD